MCEDIKVLKAGCFDAGVWAIFKKKKKSPNCVYYSKTEISNLREGKMYVLICVFLTYSAVLGCLFPFI